MTSAQHAAWIKAGSPFRLARPQAKLRDRLHSYGYTVYDLGDNRHLDHEPPEDHTPYSETGWPIHTPYGVGTAIDIMPPPAGSGLPSLQQLGAQMLADRQAGVPGMSWLKYMNWEPERDNGGPCYQESFKPNHVQVTSSDRGHIHQSGRSDMIASAVADDYDPVARIRGSGGDDVAINEIDFQALIWRVEALTTGRTTVAAGPTKGETVRPNVVLAELEAKIQALGGGTVTITGGAAGTLTKEDVRQVVDEQLDQAFKGAADADG